MKITIEHEGTVVSATREICTGNEATELFRSMLVSLTFPPSVIRLEDGGRYECTYKVEEEK